MNIQLDDFAVPEALTAIVDIDVQHFFKTGISIKNDGAQVFDQFEVVGKFHEDGPEIILAQIGTDYTAPDGIIVLKASGNPVTLGAGVTAWMLLDIQMLHRLILKAACGNVAGTVADVFGVVK